MRERLIELRSRGFNRLYQNRAVYEFSQPESLLEVDWTQPLYVLVDRIAVSPEVRARLVDAAEIGYRESSEILFEIVRRAGETDAPSTPERLRFSLAFECKNCHRVYAEPEPRLFSFNNPFGACPRCQGFGNTIDFDLDLILPDKNKSIDDGLVDPWTRPKYRTYQTELKRVAKQHGIPTNVSWYELSTDQQEVVLNGSGSYTGVHGFFAYMETKKYKLHVRVMLSKYRGYAICPECKGQRLRAEARAVRIGGKNICEAAALTISAAHSFFDNVQLTDHAGRDRRFHPERSTAAVTLSRRRGPRIPDAGPAGVDAFRRRGTAHSACDLTRLATRGRALCSRRALDRPSQP